MEDARTDAATGRSETTWRRPVPERWVQYYLGNAPSLAWLLVVNTGAFLVGVSFYVHSEPSLREVSSLLYPLFGDSPTALALATLSFVTLVPHLGRPVRDAPTNAVLSVIHTLAFVWLVKYGVWTAVALNLRPDLYFGFSPALLWDYWGIMLTHLFFLVEAALIPYYGKTSRGALGLALVLALVNDAYDYGFGFHPPLKYEPGLLLAAVTVGLSVGTVALAARVFDR
ncbi:DUF1405 domain-containing protein [Halogeometricum limi]|uniref:Uncharacterized membrane protein YpjA n=1 Tax=Halogeometricum limi TaxID=555875 RepID=A0A1I6HMS4_9EURY|nr:DUF1405 domain-containing protein [Halogeometricum limi]SFR55637.1 Uncharacterized membrane protein YpjA [Halogeometricum limi]